MKIGAGLIGILLGLYSLETVAFMSAFIGGSAMFVGSMDPHLHSISSWGLGVRLLGFACSLSALAGGAVTFSRPKIGGTLLAASAFLHLVFLGFGTLGSVFVLGIGLAATLALISASREAASNTHDNISTGTVADRFPDNSEFNVSMPPSMRSHIEAEGKAHGEVSDKAETTALGALEGKSAVEYLGEFSHWVLHTKNGRTAGAVGLFLVVVSGLLLSFDERVMSTPQLTANDAQISQATPQVAAQTPSQLAKQMTTSCAPFSTAYSHTCLISDLRGTKIGADRQFGNETFQFCWRYSDKHKLLFNSVGENVFEFRSQKGTFMLTYWLAKGETSTVCNNKTPPMTP